MPVRASGLAPPKIPKQFTLLQQQRLGLQSALEKIYNQDRGNQFVLIWIALWVLGFKSKVATIKRNGIKIEIKSSHPTISAETNFWDKQRLTPTLNPVGRRRRICGIRTATAPPSFNSIPTLEMVRSLHIHRVIENDRYNCRHHPLGCVLTMLC